MCFRQCLGTTNQLWQLQYLYGAPGSPPVVHLVAIHSSKCIDIGNISQADNQQTWQYPCHWWNSNLQLQNQRFVLQQTP